MLSIHFYCKLPHVTVILQKKNKNDWSCNSTIYANESLYKNVALWVYELIYTDK